MILISRQRITHFNQSRSRRCPWELIRATVLYSQWHKCSQSSPIFSRKLLVRSQIRYSQLKDLRKVSSRLIIHIQSSSSCKTPAIGFQIGHESIQNTRWLHGYNEDDEHSWTNDEYSFPSIFNGQRSRGFFKA